MNSGLPTRGVVPNNKLSLTRELILEIRERLKAAKADDELPSGIIFISAFILVLKRHSGSDEFVIRLSDAGDNHTSSLESAFDTSFFKVYVPGDPSFMNIVKNVRRIAQIIQSLTDKFGEWLSDDHDIEINLIEYPSIGCIEYEMMYQNVAARIGYKSENHLSDILSKINEHYLGVLKEIAGDSLKKYSEYTMSGGLVREYLNIPSTQYPLKTENGHSKPRVVHQASTASKGVALSSTNGKTFCDLFEAQAAKAPDRVAVICGEKTLTYKELDEKANQLANYLKAQYKTVGEELVGIMLERSEKAFIALLGILKSGSVCVPIDTGFPMGRKEHIIKDTGIRILLTQSDQMEGLEYKGQIFYMDAGLEKLTTSAEHCGVTVGPRDLAYVMYTSGSTGKPKGVMIEHHSVADLAMWQKEYFNLYDPRIVSQMSSLSFDGSVGEYVMALANGCTLFVINKEDSLNLIELINRHQIDVIVSGPSILKQLNPANLQRYPTVVSVGEKCPVGLFEKWKEHSHFINGYGPTEYTVYSHVWHDKETIAGSIPIGRSRSNLKTYLADETMSLCTGGKVGEIYLSGPGTGRGYLNNRQLTFEHFLPNFFYLKTLYKEVSEEIDGGELTQKEIVDAEINSVIEKVNQEVDGKLTAENIIAEIEKHFTGKIQQEAIRILMDNSSDTELTKAFLRYYCEGMFDSYKSESLSWNTFLKLMGWEARASMKGADFGCGSGELLQTIYGHGIHDVTGIDINPFFVQNLIANKINGLISRIDSPTEIFLKESGIVARSLDFAISTLTLDRVQYPANLIGNMSAVLKEGGRLILGTLLPVVEYEDGTNRSGFAYTRYENKLTPGTSAVEDKFYVIEALTRNGIDNIELFKVKTRVRSKNGVQDYELYVFCGNKRTHLSASPDHLRMYKTGDMGRWLPDGNIEFIGRADEQVKVRGHRVELGEIETALQSIPDIESAVVAMSPNRSGEDELAAYLVSSRRLDPLDIQNFLGETLPSYMVPKYYAQLESLPLNTSGKVDKSALPQPERFSKEAMIAHRAPATSTEAKLVSIWSEILNLPKEEIGVAESFFHVGGHSLQAIQLKQGITKTFGASLSIKNIFDSPTIEKMARLIDQQRETTCSPSHHRLTPEVPSDRKAPFYQNDLNLLPENTSGSGRSKHPRKLSLMPLSFGEKRLWFLYQFQPVKSIYNITKAYRINGRLDVGALEKSFTQILRRHENLRKNFLEIDGEPWAKVNRKAKLVLRKTRLSRGKKGDNQEKHIRELIDKELEKPFDLSSDLPIRVLLATISHTESVLIVSVHHIVSDAWSFNIFFRELDAYYRLYKSKSTQNALALFPLLNNQYKSYAVSQHELISGPGYPGLLDYWIRSLEGKIDQMKLPYDFGRQKADDFDAGVEEITVPASLIRRLEQQGKKYDTTLFMTAFAGFQVLLHLYTQHEHIHTAIPIAGRQREDTKDLIGFFVNTLIISTSFPEDPSFEEVLESVRQTVIDAYQHQEMPYEMLADELRKETGIASNELIQVMFAFQNVPEPFQLEVLEVDRIPVHSKYAKFDLTISLSIPERGEYVISAGYRTSRFKSGTIKRMLGYFRNLLEQVAVNPGIRLSRINLLDEHQKALILNKWNDTSRAIPTAPVHELFEKQAALTPDLMALCYNDSEAFSYRQLNEKANQLARYLLRYKTSDEEQVGILMHESDKAIISVIAVLKAGCAYLPLDPDYPENRLVSMLNDKPVKLIITSSCYRYLLDGESKGQFRTIVIDDDESAISAEKSCNPAIKVPPAHLAYIMYTSGSTGKPKKVGVEHQAIVRLVKNTNYINFELHGPDSRLLKTGSFSFDASTFEVWGMLLNGGKLFLYPGKELLDPQFLKERIWQNRINCLWLTTSWFNQLAEIDASIFSPLQVLIVGGEKLSAKHINKVKEANPHLETLNGYGPTENTTFSTYYKMEGWQQEPVPIGKPIANSTIYILNKSFNLLPVGMEGEIFVGGLGIARGYLNDEELSTQKFIPDPFRPGGRLYRTGDMGKWLESGDVSFAGRKDKQLKIRGHRIETFEIENAFNSHPSIEKAIVLAQETPDGLKCLVAFYTGAPLPAAEWRSFVSKKLPEYMIPNRAVHLGEFPLTTNGKVNKAKLLALSQTSAGAWEEDKLPQTAAEKKVAEIWGEVLGSRNPGVSDNFFHQGGNSLLAVKLMSRIKKEFDIKSGMPVSVLFEQPTIKDLAGLISKDRGMTGSCLVNIQPRGNKAPLFLIPGYLFYHNLSRHLGNDQPLFGFEPIPNKTTTETAAHYIRLLLAIQPQGPYFIGGYCAGGIVAYEMAQQLSAAGHAIGMLALFETYTREGVVSKISYRYLHQKIHSLASNLVSSSFDEKLKIMRKESGRAINYLVYTFKKIANRGYTIKPFTGKLALYKAADGMIGSANDPYMGWQRYCSDENIEVFQVPGNHDTMFKEPHVATLARLLKAQIEKTVYSKTEMSGISY